MQRGRVSGPPCQDGAGITAHILRAPRKGASTAIESMALVRRTITKWLGMECRTVRISCAVCIERREQNLLRSPGMKEESNAINKREIELKKLLTEQKEETVLLHPNMAQRYREKVSGLIAALQDKGSWGGSTRDCAQPHRQDRSDARSQERRTAHQSLR